MMFAISEMHARQINMIERVQGPLPDVAKAMLCNMAEYLESIEATAQQEPVPHARIIIQGYARTAQRLFDDSLLIAQGVQP